jgi:hypothetical protein
MSWSTFAITADLIRDKETNVFPTLSEDPDNGYSDASLIALKQTQSKKQMLLDLQEVYGFYEETDADFEELLTDHEDRFKEALSCLQLHWYFFENDMGEGSINRDKANRYKGMYEMYKKQFRALSKDSGIINSYIARISR